MLAPNPSATICGASSGIWTASSAGPKRAAGRLTCPSVTGAIVDIVTLISCVYCAKGNNPLGARGGVGLTTSIRDFGSFIYTILFFSYLARTAPSAMGTCKLNHASNFVLTTSAARSRFAY